MRPMWRVTGRLARTDLRRYLLGGVYWMPVSVLPLLSGLLLKELFDHIDDGRGVDVYSAWWLCAAFVGVELLRGFTLVVAWVYGVYWWDASATVLRANLLRSLLTAPGPAAGRIPQTSGAALARLRYDVGLLVDFVDEAVPLAGATLFAIGAVVVMARIDGVITLVLVLPMIAVGVLSTTANAVVKRLHAKAQERGAAVTGFLGEIFGNVLAIKSAGAERAVLSRLSRYNRDRRGAMVRDRLATDLLDAATGASVELGIGLVLLLAVGAMRRGDFTVGDLVLFTTYVSWLTALPRQIGSLLFKLPQAGVAVQRLERLLAAGESPDVLTERTDVYFGRVPPPDPQPVVAHDDPLRTVEVRGLTVRYAGVRDVNLIVRRGSFTVLTGAVGSGKTTVLRALLGLVRPDAGTVLWNGEEVADPGTFMTPPRVAYVSQTPRLFSAPLAENLLLGWPGDRLDEALRLAVLEQDVGEMADGLDTLVGPRGVRLSGGQVQRAAAARAFVRNPDLLVLDDLSSALDVETEADLWDRLAEAARDGAVPGTLLVVSHRRAALRRADEVIVLDRGRVAGQGSLDDMLRDCPEMRRLWSEERQNEPVL